MPDATTASDWLPTLEFGLANDSSCLKRLARVSGAEGRFTLKLDARQSSSRWQPPALDVDRPTAAFEASELSLSTQSRNRQYSGRVTGSPWNRSFAGSDSEIGARQDQSFICVYRRHGQLQLNYRSMSFSRPFTTHSGSSANVREQLKDHRQATCDCGCRRTGLSALDARPARAYHDPLFPVVGDGTPRSYALAFAFPAPILFAAIPGVDSSRKGERVRVCRVSQGGCSSCRPTTQRV